MILSYIALLILLILIVLAVFVIFWLGALPGKIAIEREHPQKDAIKICGWIGIFTGGILWVVALVWAYTKSSYSKIEDLEYRLKKLEDKNC